ncbi:MAG: MoaD/ThiS family protein [Acidobacteria bacterium]|nr:MoaD/ThiS family protein [Acidobacteriota bacterium]
MPTVFIPGSMRELSAGQAEIQVQGSTVREIISELDESHPGIKDWLVEDNRLKPNISVAVDGVVSPVGLLQDVEQDSEVHFVAAISGGCLGGMLAAV